LPRSGASPADELGPLSLEGLAQLEQVDVTLTLSQQGALTHLTGLAALDRVKNFSIQSCISLQDFEGASSLREVDAFIVEDAPGLARLSGLGNATIGRLQLTGHSAEPPCTQ
jgi:hypothetical protein